MRGLAVVLSVVVLSTWCFAQAPASSAQAVGLWLTADNSNPLPAYMTQAERGLLLPPAARSSPPSGEVYCPAEYELCDGLFMAWEGYESLLTDMTVYATTHDPTVTIWMVVDTVSEKTTAYNALASAGAVMSQVEFIIVTTDTVWIRDYGPRFIFEDGNRAIIDHVYNRPRPNDDAFNDFLAGLWGIPQYDIGLVHGGGNFHLFSNGDAFMTTLILNENPGLSEQQIKDLFHQYQNVNLTIYPAFPSSFDSTQHIDMWMLPLADWKVIIGEYSPSTGQPYTITENATADLTARGYTVYRTPGWKSGAHYTYTNSVILNNMVFLVKFGGSYASQDAQALAVVQAALPGYDIHQINCSGIIGAAGALHCIVMHVPAYNPGPTPVVNVIAPNGGETLTVEQAYEIRYSAHDDIGVTAIDIYLSTDSGVTFPHTIATGLSNTGSYAWTVPALNSTHCRIKVIAHDGEGHTGEDTSNGDFTITPYGAVVVYNYPLDSNPGWAISGGQWAFGHPTGQGGTQHGYPDPSNGYTGVNVYGVNLNGDYSTTPGGPYYVTLGPVSLKNYTGTKLKFMRWLNTDYQPYVYATIEASNNGSTWSQVWSNGTSEIAENAWSGREYDIAATADNQSTVWIRWGYQIGSGAWAYSGWNIDDVQIIATPTVNPGDLNCDGLVNFGDINPFVLALSDPQGYAAAYPDCNILNGDCNGDGLVNFDDINPFVALLTGT